MEQEEDALSDDSSASEENELQKQAEELQTVIKGNPYHYDNHVELIGLLRQLGDLDGARNARNAMSEVFPLTEGMWLEWIRDELPLVTIPEASMELRLLFERATEDYLSVEIWLQYAQFAMDQIATAPEGVAFPRDICERAIISCGLHVSKGGELWDSFRGFEMAILNSLQKLQQESPDDESLKTQVEAQYERVDKMFKRQLAVALIGMEETMTQYQQFTESSIPESGLPSYNLALKKLENLLPFEKDLADSSPPQLESYKSYLSHLKKTKEDPMLINCLYQRAVADHCLDVELWKDYLTYLNSSFPKVSSVLLPPHRQAVRNCPWVCDLWVTFGVAMERVGAEESETIAVFERGLSGGNFTSASDSLRLWTAYLDYLRRRVCLHDGQETTAELVGLRKTFKRARDIMETEYGRHGDSTDSLSLYQARLESSCYDNLEESRFLWNDMMSRHGREAKYWIQYSEMERYYGDTDKCRKILHRGVSSASDDPELMMETLLQFEREEGDLASFEAARDKCTAQMKRVEERRGKAAEKEAQVKEGRKQAKKGAKKSTAAVTTETGGGSKNKSPRQQQKHDSKTSGKRSRVQKGHVFFEDEEDDGETKPKKMKVESSTKLDVTVETGSSPRQQVAPPTSNDATMEPIPPTKSIPEPPGRPQKRKEEKMVEEVVEEEVVEKDKMVEDEGKEKKTIFVSNLKMSVTKQEVEEKFAECGAIEEVRLVKTQSRGRANAFAYVEFSSQESVTKALQLEHTELKGRIVYVSQHKERGGSAKTQQSKPIYQDNNKATLFVSNLQHNADEETLKNLFEKCGEVKDVRLVRNRDGRPKGFAYIEFVKESSAGSAVLQLDNYQLGFKRLNVAISNPPKKRGEESGKRMGKPAASSSDGTSQMKRDGRDDGGFVRPTFIPSRVRVQDQSEVPKKKASLGLMPRAVARQGMEQKKEGGGAGEEGGGGGEGVEKEGSGEAMDTAGQKLSNDDFRKLLNK